MCLSGICGTRINPSTNPSSKVSKMNLIYTTQQNKPGVLHIIVISNPGMVHLVDRVGFILDFFTSKLHSKYFLTSVFGKMLRVILVRG